MLGWVEELKPNFQFPFSLIFCLSYVLFVFHRFLKGLFLLLFAYSVTACLASAAPFATYYFLFLILFFFLFRILASAETYLQIV